MGFDANQAAQDYLDAEEQRRQKALEAEIAKVNVAAGRLIHSLGNKVDCIDTKEDARLVLRQVEAAMTALNSRQQPNQASAPAPASVSQTTPANTTTETSNPDLATSEPSPEGTTPETQPAPASSTPVGAKGKAGKVFRAMWENVQS